MKFTNTNNSILSRHYSEYLETLYLKGRLFSQTLSDIEIQNLYHTKYNLTEFDIYKYLVATDYIYESLGCDKYKLIEGITNDKNRYNNILVDLFFQNIPSDIITKYPIQIVFGIKQEGKIIQDLTKEDIKSWYGYMYWNPYSLEGDDINPHQELKSYKSKYSGYAGNSYTYYVFKQFIKLFLTEVYLYKCNGYIWTISELKCQYKSYFNNNLNSGSIKSVSELIEAGKIQKVKYQCIKVLEPQDINYLPLSDLKLYLINVNKLNNFEESYSTLIEKPFSAFWDTNAALKNHTFMENLNETIEFKSKLKSLLLKKIISGEE